MISFPSSPLGRCWKTLQTILSRILLVRPIPDVKYTRTLYPYIPGSFKYSGLYSTNDRSWFGITLSAFCMEVNTICIWTHVRFQCATSERKFKKDYARSKIFKEFGECKSAISQNYCAAGSFLGLKSWLFGNF